MKKDKTQMPKIEPLDDAALDRAQGGLLPAVHAAMGDGSVRSVSASIGAASITDGTSNTVAAKSANRSA